MLSTLHPKSPRQIKARNDFLERNLRDQENAVSWSIADEYPLVLGPGCETHSYCLYEKDTLLAHANLWPRRLLGSAAPPRVNIGLIGNVATEATHRGRGLMRDLFRELIVAARRQKLSALILWSDLSEFYQKLGFASCGLERRYCLSRKGQSQASRGKILARRVFVPGLSRTTLLRLFQARPKTAVSLARTPEEFAAQLAIPNTALYVAADEDEVLAFAVVGRGSDMQEVIHEWGAKNPLDLIAMADQIMQELALKQLLLLAPPDLPSPWEKELSQAASFCEEHAMAWVMPLEDDVKLGQALQQLFVWGLDSI